MIVGYCYMQEISCCGLANRQKGKQLLRASQHPLARLYLSKAIDTQYVTTCNDLLNTGPEDPHLRMTLGVAQRGLNQSLTAMTTLIQAAKHHITAEFQVALLAFDLLESSPKELQLMCSCDWSMPSSDEQDRSVLLAACARFFMDRNERDASILEQEAFSYLATAASSGYADAQSELGRRSCARKQESVGLFWLLNAIMHRDYFPNEEALSTLLRVVYSHGTAADISLVSRWLDSDSDEGSDSDGGASVLHSSDASSDHGACNMDDMGTSSANSDNGDDEEVSGAEEDYTES
eukprot:TRINITY_DN4113_c0_g2_i1.p1 TRINITY_DN4113_c0_g2~~TRINITY_DN4113_c0_g2_i1.p1  ORF type:complete len:292 (-),score=47.97 TRINITY_DN4113_c0_g2_i1:46-921(-)